MYNHPRKAILKAKAPKPAPKPERNPSCKSAKQNTDPTRTSWKTTTTANWAPWMNSTPNAPTQTQLLCPTSQFVSPDPSSECQCHSSKRNSRDSPPRWNSSERGSRNGKALPGKGPHLLLQQMSQMWALRYFLRGKPQSALQVPVLRLPHNCNSHSC